MRTYFESRYSPANITLVAAGRVDFEALMATAQQCCGDWMARPASRLTEAAAPHTAFTTLKKPQATQQYLLHMAAGPAADDRRRHAAKLLATILGDDSGSRLFWELVHPGRAEFAGVNHYEYEGAGVFYTYMSCEPAEIQENIQRMREIFHEAESRGVTEHELKQAQSKLASRVVLGSERTRSRMFNVGANWLYRREYRTVRQHLDDLASVTVDDVSQLLAEFPLSRATTIVVGPADDVQAPT
jgi:predicted Zn-dependent peptidase